MFSKQHAISPNMPGRPKTDIETTQSKRNMIAQNGNLPGARPFSYLQPDNPLDK